MKKISLTEFKVAFPYPLDENHIKRANHRVTARLLCNLIRDDFLPKSLLHGAAQLHHGQGELTLNGIIFDQLGQLIDFKSLKHDGILLSEPEQLMTLSWRHSYNSQSTTSQWLRLTSEITQGAIFEAGYLAYHQRENELIALEAKQYNQQDLLGWLQHVKIGHPEFNPQLFLEGWSAAGHPTHPCSKNKTGFSANELVNYCPDFHGGAAIQLWALHKDIAKINLLGEPTHQQNTIHSAHQWLSDNFNPWYQQWCQKLQSEGVNSKEYLPIAVHPWQAKHKLNQLFAHEIDSKQLLVLPDITQNCGASLSVRTLVPHNAIDAPHIKLPTAVQMTGSLRNMSPSSVDNGPKISHLLRQIKASDTKLDTLFEPLDDIISIRVNSNDSDKAAHLACSFRTNPNSQLQDGHHAILMAALFVQSPISHTPLLCELISRGYGNHANSASQFFKTWVKKSLQVFFRLYFNYGAAMEAHHQNLIMEVNQFGRLKRFLLRDSGGMSLHIPTLKKAGWNPALNMDGSIITSDWQKTRRQFCFSIMQAQFSDLIQLISHHYAIDAKQLWKLVAIELHSNLDKASANNKVRAEIERRALFLEPWHAPSFIHLRLEQTNNFEHYTTAINPLKNWYQRN